jgi:hypothetical protein
MARHAKRARRSTEERIADLEATIASIKARAERKRARADPTIRHTSLAIKAIDKALAETKDSATKSALVEARATLSACIALTSGASGTSGVLKPRPRRAGGRFDDGETLLSYVRDHPGLRGEQIAAALGTDSTSMRPTMKRLIAEGKIQTRGERRAMTYSAV